MVSEPDQSTMEKAVFSVGSMKRFVPSTQKRVGLTRKQSVRDYDVAQLMQPDEVQTNAMFFECVSITHFADCLSSPVAGQA